MRIHDLDPENRPRERFLRHGASSLSPAELLALILRSGTKNLNIIDTCNELIAMYSLEQLADLPLSELQKIKGIGQAKAMQIAAIFELNKRIHFRRNELKKIQSAADVFELHDRKNTRRNKRTPFRTASEYKKPGDPP